ncbi:6205_t:CDS:10 [Funneliformis geosporum]|uniref:SAGA-associated factor 11 n=1 Tax=Funneliformis geosporum TaxID=1117311 RepID=A0A9W4SUJ3_9GLOM|nr:6205_t:CDS:10 [Funneliformis geosporum]CAI2183715.1 8956_t:CDS:10 [Funneliformis geosporum]
MSVDHTPDSQTIGQDVEDFSQNLEDSSQSPGDLDNCSESSPIQLSDIPTKGVVAFSILCELLDECILDVAFEAHREAKLAASVCHLCKSECRSFVVTQPGLDIFGNHPQQDNSPTFECVNCQRPFPSKRYATHLEKCMGLAGRSSSRVANMRMGSERNPSSPYTLTYSEDNLNQSDSDGGLYIEKKRRFSRKLNDKSRGQSPAKYTKSKKQKSIISEAVETSSNISSKLKLPLRLSVSSISTPNSPDRGNSPIKRSFSMNELNFPDESKDIQYGDNISYNGNFASVEDTSTQSSVADNDYIDIDGDDDIIEVLQTSNDPRLL